MEIFKLYGSIFVNTDQAKKSISDTAKNAEKLGKSIQNTGSKIQSVGAGITKGAMAIGGAVIGVVGGVTAMATKASEAADEIDKMSQKIGVSREAYQELDYVLSQNGMDVNQLQGGMKALVNTMQSAQEGSKKASSTFAQLGISVTDSSGALRNQEDVFFDAIAALQSMTNETERNALANDIFGRSAQEMIPLLNSGAGSMEELRKKAHDLGLVMSDDAIDAGVKFTDTMDSLKRSAQMLGVQLGTELLPYVQQGAEYIIEHMPQIRDTIQKLIPPVLTIIEAIAKLVVWFGNLGEAGQKFVMIAGLIFAAIGPVVTIIGSLITFVGHLVAAWGAVAPVVATVLTGLKAVAVFLGGPLIAAIGLVVAAIGVWVHNWEDIKEAARLAVEEIKYKIEDLVGFFRRAWDRIKEIIKLPHFSISGDLSFNPPSVPKIAVDWYAKAMNNPMMLTSPTIFGVNAAGQPMGGGEAGSEVVSGTDTLMNMIRSASGMTKQDMQDAVYSAMSAVFQNQGLQVDLSVDTDGVFNVVKSKNREYKQRHGKSAFA